MAGADVEALSRSFRSRTWLLALLCLAGVGAAIWSGTRDEGIGEPESRSQLMVVTTADSTVNYYAVLERAGFAVEIDDYDDWLAEARAAAPDSEAEGMALLLEHADRRGFGLVVVERPGERDLSGLDLDPDPADVEDFAGRDVAALSVGDFAFPHRLTVDDPGEHPIVRMPGYGAIEAVFRQELVHAREDADRPTVAELQFEDATSLGRQMFERPIEFPQLIDAARASVDAALDDGSGARSLVPALTTGTAIPTPDGGVLLFHHELLVYSDNARTLELEAGAQMQLSWVGPEALAAGLEAGQFEPAPCPSLAGGVLPIAELPGIAAALDGSAVAIAATEGATVIWRKTGPGCEWAPVAEVEREPGLLLAPQFGGAPGRTVAARAEQTDDVARVLIYALPEPSAEQPEPEPDGGARLEPVELLASAGRRVTSLAFVDDRTLAGASERLEPAEPQGDEELDAEARVVLLDRTRPGLYLSVPVEFFAPHRRLRELIPLAPASEASGPELLLAAINQQGRAELIRLRIAAEAWAGFVAATPDVLGFGVEGQMISLIPEQLDAEILVEIDRLYGVSAAGRTLVYAGGDRLRPSELIRFDLDTRASRALTDNSIRDYLPRLAPSGGYATFVSLMQVNLSTMVFSVPRVMPID